ncbi:MAG: hypothetical protein AAGJ82_00795 [Bacteroidota bacterium]
MLTAATYLVEVTDAVGCEQSYTFNLPDPPLIDVQILNLPTGADSLTGQVMGGLPPYAYLWSTGDTTTSITSLPSATYDLQITDANGCVVTTSYLLTATQRAVLRENWLLFPNPAQDVIRLQALHPLPSSLSPPIRLIDAQGRVLNTTFSTDGNGNWQWDVRSLAAGRYGLWVVGEGVLWWVKI